MSSEVLLRLPDYFPSLINGMHDGFLLRGIDGAVIEVNTAFCRMVGFDRDEIIGSRPPHPWWPEEHLDRLDVAYQKYLRGDSSDDDLTFKRKNGQRLEVAVTSAPLRDASGQIIAYIGTVKDMTERSRIERQVAFQAHLIDQLQAAVIATDDDGVITLWNRGAEDIFGWQGHEVIGVDIRNVMTGGRESGLSDEMLRHLREGKSWEGELVAHRRDGSKVPVYVTDSPILDQHGNLAGIVGVSVDITERKRAERRLAAHHEVTRILAESESLTGGLRDVLAIIGTQLDWTLGAFWLVDEIDGVVRCVDTWSDPSIAGLDAIDRLTRERVFRQGEGLPGRVWRERRAIWAADVLRSEGFLRAEAAEEAGLHGWIAFPIASGRSVHGVVEFFSREVREPAPALIDMLTTIGRQAGQFIERRRAESSLRESENRFRVMADSVPVQLWIAGPDARRIWFNKVWLDFAGRTIEQESGDGWTERIHPDDVDRYLDSCLTALASRQSFTVEYRLRRHDGEYRWMLDTGVPRVGPDALFDGFIGSCLDITERRQGEEDQYFLSEATRILASSLDYHATLDSVAQLAAEHIADWFFVHIIGEDGQIEHMTVAHVDPAQVERVREVQRQYPPDINAQYGLGVVLRTGTAQLFSEVTEEHLAALALDSGHRDLLREAGLTSVMIVPMIARGRVIGAISFLSAESGRRYSERELAIAEHLGRRAAVAIDNARLYEEAQDAARARDQFLAVAAHELRSPLTSMKGFAQLLLRRAERMPGGTDWVKPLQTIDTQVNRVAGLVSRLLDVSRIEEKRLHLEVEPVDVVAVVLNAVGEAQLAAEHHPIRAIVQDEPIIAEIDRSRIEQVLSNLINNAVKHSPHGSLIDVQLQQGNDEVIVSVRDRGTGIDEAAQAKLFERYFRGTMSTRATSEGLGLGLYVAHGIVDAHHGSMTVESAPGQGSTFTFTIPLRQPAHTGTGQ